ncbi:MAG: alpha/beta hydrolase [Pirellulales bacterium]|nr:alpha/beta hydrolase [Pirellulales bacterium]
MIRLRVLGFIALLLVSVSMAAQADDAKPQRPTDQFFDSDGVKIHYIEQGAGEPVLLIHGFTANIQLQWVAPGVFPRLAKEFRVIALDNRGHGRSGKPHDAAEYGVKMVEDSIRLLDHLKIERAHVVGYSMGGFITNKLLSLHPERVITATLGGAGWSREGDKRFEIMDQLADSLDAGTGIAPLLKFLTPEGAPPLSEEQIKTYNQMVLLLNDPKALAAAVRGMKGLMIPEEKLLANTRPVLALIGSKDPLKAGVDELEKVKMPQLTVEVIDGADHMDAFGRPEFIEGLEKFLDANRVAQPAAAAAGN